MFTCPTRAAPAFAPTDSSTAPLAFPDCPDATPIHDVKLDALQLQPVSVATPTESDPPLAPIESLVRLSEYWHGAAAWLS